MRRPLAFLLALLALSRPAAAQQRADQARLSFGVGLSYNGGTPLWQVNDQPLREGVTPDTAQVGRDIRATIGVTFAGIYYPNPKFGFSGEVHLVGLAFEDHCRMLTNNGSLYNQAICTNLQGAQSPGTAVAATVGGIVRPFAWSSIQPYVRANLGLTLSQQSTIRMRANYRDIDTTVTTPHTYFIYDEGHPASIYPAAGLATGFTAFVGGSYQVRTEFKDNFIFLDKVTGPAQFQGQTPPNERVLKQIFTFTMAFEVVLEKRRGRRY